ncbi:hypothetical protein [Hydrogenivirga sp. 128-5-R1-1]|uniref:hypothetical protein n=1 Tax=Hydrogenivirga sp. 128-5-R1-1 TaxID=392423 RepID=UPI00015F19D3|nr:hypothetical protein [Hydrogenivirga sp. 128-5-R1-1]EDP73844.1 hypothetical protein HG1285_10622 [Hydrogenivirga sp. 128-5-R1-1]
MKKLIEKITTDKGIALTLEYDVEEGTYLLTIEKDSETVKFKGSIEEIQKASKKYFINSLKHLKNQIEISQLEELFKRS